MDKKDGGYCNPPPEWRRITVNAMKATAIMFGCLLAFDRREAAKPDDNIHWQLCSDIACESLHLYLLS